MTTKNLFLSYKQIAKLFGTSTPTAMGIAHLNGCKRFSANVPGRAALLVAFPISKLEILGAHFDALTDDETQAALNFVPEGKGEVCPSPAGKTGAHWTAPTLKIAEKTLFLGYNQLARIFGKTLTVAVEVAHLNGCRSYRGEGTRHLIGFPAKKIIQLGGDLSVLSDNEIKKAISFTPTDEGKPCKTYGNKISDKWKAVEFRYPDTMPIENPEGAPVEEVMQTKAPEDDSQAPSGTDVVIELTRIFQVRIRELEDRNRHLERVLALHGVDPDASVAKPSWKAQAA
jgi:hypothetical protein